MRPSFLRQSTLACALAGVLALPGPSAWAQAGKGGWWIRVDPKKTEATGIGLEVGASKAELRVWKAWRTGEALEFDLPPEVAGLPQLLLRATAIPDDEDVWFCIFHKGQGVRRFDFDTVETVTLKDSDRDGACRPS